ncbi:LEAF RUST 10 DISEASE-RESISTANCEUS RECEPTOR-LIKE PROTEIN KINASE-like 1.1 isoform X2 [Rutidosis leptorrhynchoides]|uniref:LEAF RUST 10 DISEASE-RESISTANCEUS RECEPTOR-LIKE PROTEIN KINASE-like 1.1 isoform X2 n=1 Tax=Rutidosis leptorrhynchoides TaxID=125765 RepID=UPI003A9A1A07
MMTGIFFFTLSCLLILHSATPTCPKSFSCPNLSPFNYPFYRASDDTSCGLIKVNCDTKMFPSFQFGTQQYEIYLKLDSSSSFRIRNETFQKLVSNESCDGLMSNFTSPSPLLFSYSIHSFITVFKCTKNLSNFDNTYFGKPNYNSYGRCKDYNFYYNNPFNSTIIPNDLPRECQVIQLPLKEEWQRKENLERKEVPINDTNIFYLLSSMFSVSFPLSISCKECHEKGNRCNTTDKGDFECLYTEKEIPHIKEKPHRKLTLILVIVGSTFIFMLFLVIFLIWRQFKGNPFSYFSSKHNSAILEDDSFLGGVSVFSYSELEYATHNFNPSNELGDGGFGAVYYGKLKDGREIAVKRLYDHNYKRIQHFKNEVDILTRLRHPNLVVLYGSTSGQSRELLLVYEYISNGTVADHLHGERANRTPLTWPIRMNIAIETASALVYLHASEIIHRDVKTNNILVDNNFSVKVADFGLSRLVPNNVTHVSTAPQGTPGYVDPQYHQRYQLTDKSDVYSFGVVLIELISSMVAVDLKRSRDEISLANLALNKIQRCEVDQLIDPDLVSDSNEETKNMITSVAELAFQCLQYDSEMRPTMNEVLDVLLDIQATGRIDGHYSYGNLNSVNPPPPSEASDTVVLIKDFLPSPVSVTNEWQSENSASTTRSNNADRLPINSRSSI